MSAAPEPEGSAKKPAGKKKLIVMVLAVLLLGGGGAGAWFSGFLPGLLNKSDGKPEGGGHGAAASAAPAAHGGGHGAKAEKSDKPDKADKTDKAEKGGPMFMELPDIVANLNAGPRRSVFVKLKAKLEVSRPEDQAALQAAMPRVLDLFQGYLREMRPEELRGSAGTYRLREELLARTNLAAPPARVVAVLFTEMLVQ